ncbi:MAG: methyltransferase family protein [Promethearchaeota archaeon]
MEIKGLNKFREKLPILSGKRIILLPIYTFYTLSVLFLFIQFVTFIYSLPNNSNQISMIFPLLGILLLEIIALFLVYQFWLWRDKLKAKYKQKSYQKIIFVGFAGITIMMALAFNNLTPIIMVNPELGENSLSYYLFSPLTSIIVGNWLIIDILRYIIGIMLLLIGIMTMVRSLETFGIDYMALVYLYFPEESEVQNYEIYSILRHPAYSGVILVCFAGFIINLSLFNLIYFVIFIFGFSIHIIFVEEKELIQRFGESYDTYRKSIPAIFVRPRNWKIFFKFLF